MDASDVRPPRRLLAELGVSEAAETLYLALLSGGLPDETAGDEVIAELIEADLAVVADGVPSPRSAARALRNLEQQHLEDAHRAKVAALELDLLEQGGRRTVETTRSPQRAIAMFNQIFTTARTQFRGMDRPPYLTSSGKQASTQQESLRHGVRHRALYEMASLHDPEYFRVVAASIRQGEQARFVERLPFRMLLADETTALILRHGPDDGVITTRITDTAVVATFGDLFEQLWQTAVPMPRALAVEETLPHNRELIWALASGMTDEAIARQLGVSLRTVARRVAELNRLMGTQSRFQLGMQAVRLGWLPQADDRPDAPQSV
ncbi:helix-turn-helix domain-containing protein [Actinomyces ruminicola]|uniref:Homeodomain-like domain-containing protein n=1 Tax=Actinomyces ruminicola TaxID=332524 RepID=A0A1H0ALX3_9ACTO|nr:helix-turn-helix domain-containing protein [Actinomyces ruminicola]SDN34457.1 Homeodomain-like domain-containing protein [Actinomyces ruminicola]